jgi:uncharacterized protein involved in high-affinity Fe2+ transport
MRSCVFGINEENFTAPKVNHCVVAHVERESGVGRWFKKYPVFKCL